MTEIFLIRHTQAEGNLYRMMQGHWDGDVTAALAERFKDIPVDAVYSSDLYRARMTAGAVTKYHGELELQQVPALREIDVGPWETAFFGNVFHEFPQQADDFVNHPGRWRIDGAETYAAVQERAYAALEDIARRHDGQRVVVVSHGVTIRCIMSRVLGVPLEGVETLPIFFNTSVTTLHYSGGRFTAKGQNDCTHLEKLNSPVWRKNSGLRDEPMDPRAESRYYAACYAASWLAAHGTLRDYDEGVYLTCAREHYLYDGGSVLKILDGDDPVGLVDMDVLRGAREGYGWISLIYLREDYRGKGYGIQLLARAIKKYTNLGRTALRLHVAEENAAAVRFYESCGFTVLSREQRTTGPLLLMGRELGGRKYV